MSSNNDKTTFVMSGDIKTDDDLYYAIEWMKKMEQDKYEDCKKYIPNITKEECKMCAVPCERKPKIGRSWWKSLGYCSDCSCAKQSYEQVGELRYDMETNVIGRIELMDKMKQFNIDNGIQEPEQIDMSKLNLKSISYT